MGCAVSISTKNTNAQIMPSTAPARYTGLRPILSDSAPHSGTAIAFSAAPSMVAVNAMGRDRCSTVVT
ncbi:hypothetical protein G6F35_017581 [Rhizopus arrhizus]|nr:hypothetical protein G6F35_017581 [Rhizopus arrhizus]